MSHDQPTHLQVYRHNAKAAVRNGFAVKSLSRRGEPPAAAIAGGWAASVEWIQADAMEPGTYEHELHGVRTSTCTCTCTSAKCGGYAFPCCVCVCVCEKWCTCMYVVTRFPPFTAFYFYF